MATLPCHELCHMPRTRHLASAMAPPLQMHAHPTPMPHTHLMVNEGVVVSDDLHIIAQKRSAGDL